MGWGGALRESWQKNCLGPDCCRGRSKFTEKGMPSARSDLVHEQEQQNPTCESCHQAIQQPTTRVYFWKGAKTWRDLLSAV